MLRHNATSDSAIWYQISDVVVNHVVSKQMSANRSWRLKRCAAVGLLGFCVSQSIFQTIWSFNETIVHVTKEASYHYTINISTVRQSNRLLLGTLLNKWLLTTSATCDPLAVTVIWHMKFGFFSSCLLSAMDVDDSFVTFITRATSVERTEAVSHCLVTESGWLHHIIRIVNKGWWKFSHLAAA